jgi:hypothetical protein
MARPKDDDADAPLKRLGGGRWQTRDERFTIEPQSGTWVVVDAEQTDDLGLPLVRGPFPSLTTAKEAIAGARSSGPAESPLAARLEQPAKPRVVAPAANVDAKRGAALGTRQANEKDEAAAAPAGRPKAAEEPSEPGWLTALEPDERGRARRLMQRLADDGVPDAEGIVRRDLVGGVPALAAHAIERRLAELADDASPAAVVEVLAEGRDSALGVRWRIVDGDGRPIVVEAPRRRRRG